MMKAKLQWAAIAIAIAIIALYICAGAPLLWDTAYYLFAGMPIR